jgi:FMN phosphatase YigB (HAD superfamily)
VERATERPLICYVTRTNNVPPEAPAYIDNSDLTGFSDLVQTVEGTVVDVLIVSNGGSPDATERIVRLLREKFDHIRFIVPGNAYSAATLTCFAGDEILVDAGGTLGPIDPQVNGIPARAILRGFEKAEERLKEVGPSGLTAYMPLLEKYDLHLLEMCESAEELSRELARDCLSNYMLKIPKDDQEITNIIDHFSDFDLHKSHGRSIDRTKARELGLKVTNLEDVDGITALVRSLYNQFEYLFDRSPFYKLFENTRGVSWGRQHANVNIQIPIPQPEP